jgi:hypothetical protein
MKLQWDQVGDRTYETGVDKGVLYLPDAGGNYDQGFAWNGLVTVTEAPSGAAATPQYADNIKYLNLVSTEMFDGTIDAFTYPDEFSECDGTVEPTPGVKLGQQPRKTFGLCYRTRFGNDVDGYGPRLQAPPRLRCACCSLTEGLRHDQRHAGGHHVLVGHQHDSGRRSGAQADCHTGGRLNCGRRCGADFTRGHSVRHGWRRPASAASGRGHRTVRWGDHCRRDHRADVQRCDRHHHDPGHRWCRVLDRRRSVPAGPFGPIAADTVVTAAPAPGFEFDPASDTDWTIRFA